jgi:hypothetical protein
MTNSHDAFNFQNLIIPFREIVAYKALWENRAASFKSLSELSPKFLIVSLLILFQKNASRSYKIKFVN